MLRRALAIATLTLIAATCRDGSGPAAPDRIIFSEPEIVIDAIGGSRSLTAIVQDANGAPLSHVPVTWEVASQVLTLTPSSGNESTVSITAILPGRATVTARAGNVSAEIDVIVQQVIARINKLNDAQVGVVGLPLNQRVIAVPVDANGHAITGIPVEFAVQSGGGSVSTSTVVTEFGGAAPVVWTMGTSNTVDQRLTATVGDVSVTFTALALAGPPVRIEKIAGDEQVAPTGYPVQSAPVVRLFDSYGNRVVGAGVTFAPSSGGSVRHATPITSSQGEASAGEWILGYPAGEMTLTASVASYHGLAPVVFSATATPDGFVPSIAAVHGGDWQAAIAGTAVPTAPAVVVRDENGVPQPGRRVTFEITTGGGAISESVVTTDQDGIARVGWTLAAAAGFNSLVARVEGGLVSGNPLRFDAAGCTAGSPSGFAISVCFLTPVTESQRSTFLTAAAKWASIITGDLSSLDVALQRPWCGGAGPDLDMVIDDLVIFARIEPIDGSGGVLGSAGWCYRRSGGLPLLGGMRFDAADVANLQASGRFEDVILHEMGHVLGIGTLWNAMGFLQDPSPVGGPALDTHFNGLWAIGGFDQIGGLSYTSGAKVPVENTRGAGSINSHWRETVLGAELMTPAINIGVSNPLTVLTALSLRDLGYEVNPAGADPFSVFSLFGEDLPDGPKLWLGDDAEPGPRYTIDRLGRVNRIR